MANLSGTPGGCVPCKEIENYAQPVGPSRATSGGSPGLGGTNYGNSGTQGPNSPNGRAAAPSPVPWINRGK